MAKFVMECPSCGVYVEASGGMLGFFSTKKINCKCGYVINVKTDKVTSKQCPHCRNMVVYDQSKGESALCPVCHEKINTSELKANIVDFFCPSCSCHLSVDKNAMTYICPLCETNIDVQNQVAKEKLKKEDLVSVIKFEGDADTLVWKHPIEDFNMGTQLIVHESQEAIFFKDGRALDLFGAGRYTLETGQMPILEKMYQLPADTERTFHSEIYYVNLVTQMALKWGTPDKIVFVDPRTEVPMAIGARGIMNFKIKDSRKIIMKLVGTTAELKRQDLFGNEGKNYAKEYFKSIVQLGVSTKLAETIRRENIDVVQIDLERMRLSNSLKEDLMPYFNEYGIEITEFVVEGIMLPQQGDIGFDSFQTILKLRQWKLSEKVIETETEIKLKEMEAKKNLNIREQENAAEIEIARRGVISEKGETDILQAQLEGQKELAKVTAETAADRLRLQLEMERKTQIAQIEAEEMRAKGYTQRDVFSAEVMKTFAENQPNTTGGFGTNISEIAGQAMQMGTGFATMGAVAGLAGNMMGAGAQLGKEMSNAVNGIMPNNSFDSPSTTLTKWNCDCGMIGITSKFCPECGNRRP